MRVTSEKKQVGQKLRRTIFLEMGLLLVVSCLTVAPLALGHSLIPVIPETVVDIYYGLSMAILLFSQALYMIPVKTFRVTNWKFFIGGILVVVILLLFWINGADGRVMAFDDLERGAIFSPIVFSIAISTLHGFAHIIGSNAVWNDTSSEL